MQLVIQRLELRTSHLLIDVLSVSSNEGKVGVGLKTRRQLHLGIFSRHADMLNGYGLPGEAVVEAVVSIHVVFETLRGRLTARESLGTIIASETSRWYTTE
jgi:hypothetical protein